MADCDPLWVGSAIPSYAEALALFEAFKANVHQLERRLKTRRQKAAKQRRLDNPALICRDIRGAQAKQVEAVVDCCQTLVAQVLPDESAVVLKNPVHWRPTEGFFLNDAPLEVFHAEPDKIWGQIASAAVGDVVSQQRPIADLPGLFRAFGDEWSRRWMKHEAIDVDHWQAVLESLPPQSSPAYCLEPLCVSKWKAAIQAKHAHSATGPDGVSRADLLALPEDHTISLLALCRRAELTGDWPRQMLDARVSALEKLPDAATVMQYRPICVLSVAYRTWSSLRAREALQHLEKIAPPTLFGNMPGRSAGCVWYQMQLAVEQAHVDNKPLVGALLDLSKAFNTLPRPPVFALAIRLGLPKDLVVAWSSAVAKLARRFRIRGATGPPLASYTGFPEGCALSCVAMLLVDFALHRYVDTVAGPETLTTFVDDWQLLDQGVPQVKRALDAVHEFVRGWDLTMDPTKTVHWATHAADRRALRKAGVAVAHSARNLGGNMTFTRARMNSTIMSRVHTLQELWPRLAASPAPFVQKLKAVITAAWPKALHGISAVTVGDSVFNTMRAGAARGLGLDRPGLNSKALLSFCCYPMADPQFFALVATFQDLRAFADPVTFVPLLETLLSMDGRWPPGPAQAFLERCHAVGFAWCVGENCLCDAISAFDPWQVSPQELRHRLVYAWQSRVGTELEVRAGFSGMSQVDAAHTAQLIKHWAPVDRLNLRLVQSGAFFTQDALCHFSQDPSDSAKCRFCPDRDSLEHRLWRCPAFADCRASLAQHELPDPATDVQALSLRGWALQSQRQLEFWKVLYAVPDSCACFDWPGILPDFLEVFTDGSCLLPTIPQVRLASWAVVLAASHPGRPWIISSGPLPGLIQTAFRAEIFAVLSALTFANLARRPVRIWSDCAGVIRKLRRLQTGDIQIRPSMLNCDLWRRVADVMAQLTVPWSVHKVAAHVDAEDSKSALEDWLIFNNDVVDRAADAANYQRPASFWEIWESVRRDYALQDVKARAGLELQRIVAAKATAGKDALWTAEVEILGTSPPEIRLLPDPIPRSLHKYGCEFVGRLANWLVGLTALPVDRVQWYSFAQLYLAFCFEVELVPPIYDTRLRQWLPFDPDSPAMAGISFAVRARFFRQQVRATVAQGQGKLRTTEIRPYSSALAIKLPACSIGLREDVYGNVEAFLSASLPHGVCKQNERSWVRIPAPRCSLG